MIRARITASVFVTVFDFCILGLCMQIQGTRAHFKVHYLPKFHTHVLLKGTQRVRKLRLLLYPDIHCRRSGKRRSFIQIFTVEDMEKGAGVFGRFAFPSTIRGCELWADNGPQNWLAYLVSAYTAPRYKNQTLLQTPRQ
jgi:hypothetical protein